MDGLKHIPWVTPVAGVKHLSVKEVKPYTSEYHYAALLNVSISTHVPAKYCIAECLVVIMFGEIDLINDLAKKVW